MSLDWKISDKEKEQLFKRLSTSAKAFPGEISLKIHQLIKYGSLEVPNLDTMSDILLECLQAVFTESHERSLDAYLSENRDLIANVFMHTVNQLVKEEPRYRYITQCEDPKEWCSALQREFALKEAEERRKKLFDILEETIESRDIGERIYQKERALNKLRAAVASYRRKSYSNWGVEEKRALTTLIRKENRLCSEIEGVFEGVEQELEAIAHEKMKLEARCEHFEKLMTDFQKLFNSCGSDKTEEFKTLYNQFQNEITQICSKVPEEIFQGATFKEQREILFKDIEDEKKSELLNAWRVYLLYRPKEYMRKWVQHIPQDKLKDFEQAYHQVQRQGFLSWTHKIEKAITVDSPLTEGHIELEAELIARDTVQKKLKAQIDDIEEKYYLATGEDLDLRGDDLNFKPITDLIAQYRKSIDAYDEEISRLQDCLEKIEVARTKKD